MLAFPTAADLTAAGNVTAIVRNAGAATSSASRPGQSGPILGQEAGQRLKDRRQFQAVRMPSIDDAIGLQGIPQRSCRATNFGVRIVH